MAGYRKGQEIGREVCELFSSGSLSLGVLLTTVVMQVGFYLGFAENWLNIIVAGGSTSERTERSFGTFCDQLTCLHIYTYSACKALTSLLTKAQRFNVLNFTSDDYTDTLTVLRAKYKQVHIHYTCVWFTLILITTDLFNIEGVSTVTRFNTYTVTEDFFLVELFINNQFAFMP